MSFLFFLFFLLLLITFGVIGSTVLFVRSGKPSHTMTGPLFQWYLRALQQQREGKLLPSLLHFGVSISKPVFCMLSEVRPHWRNSKEVNSACRGATIPCPKGLFSIESLPVYLLLRQPQQRARSTKKRRPRLFTPTAILAQYHPFLCLEQAFCFNRLIYPAMHKLPGFIYSESQLKF